MLTLDLKEAKRLTQAVTELSLHSKRSVKAISFSLTDNFVAVDQDHPTAVLGNKKYNTILCVPHTDAAMPLWV